MSAVVPKDRPVKHPRRRPSGEPPPLPRSLNRAAVGWLIALSFFAGLWLWIFLSDKPAVWITERDLAVMDPIVDNRTDWLDDTFGFVNRFGTHWATPVVGWSVLIASLAVRRIRHALLLIGSLSVVALAVTTIAERIRRPRPLGMEIIGDWTGFAQPSRPVALLSVALVSAGMSLVPARYRPRWFWGCGAILTVFGFAQVYTAAEHPTDPIAGATAGIAITLLLYRLIAPEAVFPITYVAGRSAHLDISGQRAQAIRTGLQHQLSIDATSIEPCGWDSSAGSTPLRIQAGDGQVYFGKLYARNHLRSDRSYKLVRTLLYGRLEDERSFSSVRHLVQHEDHMLRVARSAGLPCAEPLGIVELTPEREYLLVTDFFEGGADIGTVDVTNALIDDALGQIALMWHSGLAHRDIKPSNVMVHHGRIHLVDVAFAQIRPSPWRQAVDLANMMLVLALGSSAKQVYDRARLVFSDDEIAEAFAASRGLTVPRGLRSSIRDGGVDLLEQFKALVPERRTVTIQRWSIRRIGLMLWFLVLAALLLGIFLDGLSDIGLR